MANGEFCLGILGALGIYLDDGAEYILSEIQDHRSEIYNEELLYQMTVLPFRGTSAGWNLRKSNQRKCKALCPGEAEI